MNEGFDYPELLRAATLSVVREVLDRAAEEGLPGEHHFFLTFRTRDPGVQLPSRLMLRYPETMTVVIQHQYEDLLVDEDAFEVSLRFGGSWERLRVAFDALTAFLDPSVPFGLDFTQFRAAGEESLEGGPMRGDTESEGSEGQPRAAAEEEIGETPPTPGGGDLLPFRRP